MSTLSPVQPRSNRGQIARATLAAAAITALAAPAATAAERGAVSAVAPTMTVTAMPVTSTRAAMAITLGHLPATAKRVQVSESSGTSRGSVAITTSGKALVPVAVPAGGSRSLVVTVPGTALRRTVSLTTAPAYLDTSSWHVVNKRAPVVRTFGPVNPATYAGVTLDQRAGVPLQQLIAAAGSDGVGLGATSGYRSYDRQAELYAAYVERDGREAADTYSARPGFSEHQTGLVLDAKASNGACTLQQCFADTPSGRWLAEHAAQYGFVIRYTPANGKVTGYKPEPWHLRYVGTWLAGYLAETDTASVEQAMVLPAAPDYS